MSGHCLGDAQLIAGVAAKGIAVGELDGNLFGQIAGQPAPLPEPAGDFHDAAAGQAVLDAARRSAAERRWVEVEKA